MALSSNSLIHFTSSIDSLLGILEGGFKLKYCREEFSLIGSDEVLHVPMVSFCDIPFSQVVNHIERYGCYGIGLSKEWAVRNRLNPVLYVQDNSLLANSYYSLMTFLHDKETKGEIDEEPRRLGVDIVRYIKNYEGMLKRRDLEPELYRFSDEREWRYVPPYSDSYNSVYLTEAFEKETAARANRRLNGLRLKFDANDINYIVIDNDTEIAMVADHMNKTKSDKYTLSQAQRIMTRIITYDQICGDF
ncbi:abortive infection system antitoxin AbiGi family protein [Stenotrophomonas sp. SPM]|uniref:abortive infection system antitoxin AbiGi family protein n=1 Tax=Stenotrophomonas sp. SPM TaxID=2170735 RepID=UPI001401D5AB|nr:abortive infection system antitoxin AbiGi family protein [Stenotrophomonas sp. SPM]